MSDITDGSLDNDADFDVEVESESDQGEGFRDPATQDVDNDGKEGK
jgi:hypothetical protein